MFKSHTSAYNQVNDSVEIESKQLIRRGTHKNEY